MVQTSFNLQNLFQNILLQTRHLDIHLAKRLPIKPNTFCSSNTKYYYAIFTIKKGIAVIQYIQR